MTDENHEARAQAHLASLKRDMKASMEDAVVRAMHKVMAEFEAKSDDRLMEDWGPGPHECHSLPEQPAQQEPVAWRWSESNGQRWFDWTTDWSHHDKAKSMGVPIEYAYTSPPAQQCKWPTCQSEEYQQALAEQIKRELVGEQPARRKPLTGEQVTDGCRSLGVGVYQTLGAAFEAGVRFAEAAHGIKENT